MQIETRIDDLSSPEVQKLIAEHLAGMQSNSPPAHVNAFALESLRQPDVTFWSAWSDSKLCGCGALKELGKTSGEVKSMRTRYEILRKGVAQAVLDEISRVARSRRYERLYLETMGIAFTSSPSRGGAHALVTPRREGCIVLGEAPWPT